MKSKPAVKMPDLVAVSKDTEKDRTAAGEQLAVVRSVAIVDAEDYKAAAQSIALIKQRFEEIDSKRRSWVDPLNGVIKSLNAFCKPALDFYSTAEREMKLKLVAYANAQAEAQDAAVEKMAKAKTPGDKKKLLAAIDASTVPRIGGVSMRTTWTGRVVDASKLPREYLVPNEALLKAATRSKNGDPKIPGWEAFPETIAAVSTTAADE